MKTPEELAREYADGLVFDEGMFNTGERAFLAGYQAARDEYEAKIKELETELDNWQHAATHGDEGL